MPTDPWDRRTRVDDWRGNDTNARHARGLAAELVSIDPDPQPEPKRRTADDEDDDRKSE